MAGNYQPIFSAVGRTTFSQLAAANNTAALNTNAALVFSPGTNGSILTEVRIKLLPGTTFSAATAFRLWIATNTAALATTTNNLLISETAIPIIPTTNTSATPDYYMPMPRNGLCIPPTIGGNACAVYATIGSYSAGTIMITGIGGDF